MPISKIGGPFSLVCELKQTEFYKIYLYALFSIENARKKIFFKNPKFPIDNSPILWYNQSAVERYRHF